MTDVLVLGHTTSGTLANNIGVGVSVAIEALASVAERFRIDTTLSEITNGNEDTTLVMSGMAIGNMAASVTITDQTKLTANPSTVATTSTTGSLTAAGGVGIAKQLYVGGIMANAWTESDAGYSTYSSTKGSLLTRGGAGFAKRVYAGVTIVAEGTTGTEDADEGALLTTGGAGFAAQVYSGGILAVKGTEASEGSTSGSLVVMGGAGVAANIYAGAAIVAEGTTAATTASGGSLVGKGGAAINLRMYTGGALVVTGTTSAVDKISGAVVVRGGMSAAGSIYVGGHYVAGIDDNNVANAVSNTMVISHSTSGTAANGIGVGINVGLEDQGDMTQSAGWTFTLDDVTDGNEDTSSIMTFIEAGSMVTGMSFTSEKMSIRDALRMNSGTVSQASNINTGVTLNTESGVITTQSANTAAHDCDAFVVTNNKVAASTAVFVSMGTYSGNLIITNPVSANGLPMVSVSALSSGSFTIQVCNGHSSRALSGTLKVNFNLLQQA